MSLALQVALKQLQTRLCTNYVSLIHTSAVLQGGGPRTQTKGKGKGGRKGGGFQKGSKSIGRKPSAGPSRRRLENFKDTQTSKGHLEGQRIITAPKNFGLRRDSESYKAAEEEERENKSKEISKKKLARQNYLEEKHKQYEKSLSYQSFVERDNRRKDRPNDTEGFNPRSKVGELAITDRPTEHDAENLPKSFSSTALNSPLLEGVREVLGSNRPSPIQALSLKYLFPPTQTINQKKKDAHTFGEHLLASETGTGKTIAYLLPLLQHLKETGNPDRPTTQAHMPRALVLAPTHELTRQLTKTAKSLVHAKGAELRLLCSSTKNTPSSGVGRDSVKVTARKMKSLLDQEFEITRDSEEGAKKSYPVDVIFTTPMKGLEMIKGRGWDRELRDDQGNIIPGVTEPQEEEPTTNARQRRGNIPEARREGSEDQSGIVKEMKLRDVEWVVVDEADVLFDPDFRQYTELLLAEIAAARAPKNVNSSIAKIEESSEAVVEAKPSSETRYPFHLTLTSATIPLSLSSYLSEKHPRMTYLTSPNLHKLPRKLKVEHVNWTGGNHNSDVETKIRSVWSEAKHSDTVADGDADKVLIFANKNSKVEELGRWLKEKGVNNVAMTSQSSLREYGSNKHIAGFLKAPATSRALTVQKQEAKEPEVVSADETNNSTDQEPKVLITTSLLSRGLDFSPSIRNVFILDSPRNMIDFLHRAGRTARAGKPGRVVIFQKESGRGSAPTKKLREKVRKLF